MSNGVKVRFTNPNKDNFDRNIMYSSALGLPALKQDCEKDKTGVIIGSGPSLNATEVHDELVRLYVREDTVFYGCKAAIKWLYDHGMPPKYGVSMDPGAHIACDEKIYRAPGVTHIMASVTAPEVFDYLKDEKVIVFHSVCGSDNEVALYKFLHEDHHIMQGGYNVINRALAVAQFSGCARFVLAGCDSGWREGQNIYADGRQFLPTQKKVLMCDEGMIDGINWHSTPDMVGSAVALTLIAKDFDSRGESDKMLFLGDVLPRALREKDDDFLNQIVVKE